MGAEDPLFILYTSGSTGKPKGVLHTTGGYLVYAAITHKLVFDYHPGDIYCCAADVGWVTGHTLHRLRPARQRRHDGDVRVDPHLPGRRALLADGRRPRHQHLLHRAHRPPRHRPGRRRVGEALQARRAAHPRHRWASRSTPRSGSWYHDVVGDGRCAVVDTWWQTETGGILITPLPGATPTKPGSATLPFFGVKPVLVDPPTGKVLEGNGVSGTLCLAQPWPGQARTIYGDHQRFRETYFSQYPGLYFTGDGCRRDEDGYYWITGRVDDVLNVSGHRLGTAEVESALVAHEAVAEAAVVGFPHDIKGQGIYAYVHARLGYASGTPDATRRGAQGAGAPRHRRLRHARRHPRRRGPAQDPQRQDHAPHPAQDRRLASTRASATSPRWPIPRWWSGSSPSTRRTLGSRRSRVKEAPVAEAEKNRGVVVAAAGTGINLALGILYTWSVLKGGIPAAWHWSDADKALPYSVACLVFAMAMIPAGALQDRMGPRRVATLGGVLTGLGCIVASQSGSSLAGFVVGFGVLVGIGFGFGYGASTPPAVKWFPPQKTGMVAGAVVAGFGLASVYIAPLATKLLDVFAKPNEAGVMEKGISSTMLVFGVGFLIIVTGLAQLLVNPPPGFVAAQPATAKAAPPKAAVDVDWREMVRTPQFYVLWIMYFAGSAAG